jgi:hypothetical protein
MNLPFDSRQFFGLLAAAVAVVAICVCPNFLTRGKT